MKKTKLKDSIQFFKGLKIVPRWLIYILDLSVATAALFISFLLLNNLWISNLNWALILDSILLTNGINSVVFAALRTYRGIVRYTGFQDAVRIFISVCLSVSVLFLIQWYSPNSSLSIVMLKAVLIAYGILSFLFMLGYRVLIKHLFQIIRNYKIRKKNVVIFGAGESGVATKRVLMHDTRTNFNILTFIDDDRKKTNKSVDGISVMSFDQFREFIMLNTVDELIISSFSLSSTRKNEIVDFCLDHEINVMTVPPYNQWYWR